MAGRTFRATVIENQIKEEMREKESKVRLRHAKLLAQARAELAALPKPKTRPTKDYLKRKATLLKKIAMLGTSQERLGFTPLVVEDPEQVEGFMNAFLKHGGNATEAAMEVFHITNRANAAAKGSLYLKKIKGIGALIVEKKGYHYGKMIEHAIKKMEESNKTDWFEIVARAAGYDELLPNNKGGGDATQVVNIVQTEQGVLSKYIEVDSSEPVIDLSQEFIKEEAKKNETEKVSQ